MQATDYIGINFLVVILCKLGKMLPQEILGKRYMRPLYIS